MDIKKVYLDGWRVFGRWFWFSLILGIIQLPFRLGFKFLLEKEIIPNEFYIYPLAVLVFLVLFSPFILFFVSERTGEFIAPRINRKKLHEINNRPFGMKNDSNIEPTQYNARI